MTSLSKPFYKIAAVAFLIGILAIGLVYLAAPTFYPSEGFRMEE